MKKRGFFFLSIMIGIALFLSANHIALADETATSYRDDLNSFDSTKVELANWANGGAFDCRFYPVNASFTDGIMSLKIDSSDKYGYRYSAAEYRTVQRYDYGTYKVSMKPIRNDGVVSSFFTYTGPALGTQWDEIDIEFLGKDTTKVQFTFFTNGKKQKEYLYQLGFDAAQSFHEYGFTWLKDSITWEVDGQAVYSVSDEQYDIPVTPGKIMANVWNGNPEKTKYWLNVYDGKTPLIAEYNYIEWEAARDDSMAASSAASSETSEEPSSDSSSVSSAAESSVTTSVPVTGWTTDTSDLQYTLDHLQGVLRVTRSTSQSKANASFSGEFSVAVSDPTRLSYTVNYMNGSRLALTVILIDSEGNERTVSKVVYLHSDKGEHTENIDLSGLSGNFKGVRIMMNSNPEQVNLPHDAYCRAIIENMTLSR